MEHLVKWLYTVSASTFIFIVLIYIVSSLVLQKRKRQRLPPCPWSIPVIGHLHLLRKSPLHRSLHRLSAQYGHVFGLKLGNQYTVVVSSPAAVEECFGTYDLILADRKPDILAAKHLHYDSTSMITARYGDHWRNVRRISNQELFSVSKQTTFQSLKEEAVKSMIKTLFSSTRQGMQKVAMKSRIAEMTFNIIVRIATGKRYYGEGAEDPAEAQEFLKILSVVFELSGLSNLGDFIPFLRLTNYRGYETRMLKWKKRMDDFLQKLVDESKTEDGGATQSILRNLLLSQKADAASLSDDTIKGLVLVLTAGGVEPSADTIEWAMSALLNEPEKLKKAQQEMDAVISPGRLIEERDISKLPYLQAIVSETQRMYPTAPLLMPHYSSSECTIQGFYVPRGTMVVANAWAIHRDPKVWDDPLCFKPERFENVKENHTYKLFPFGIGRRSCPGAGMAHKVVMLGLGSLIQCFDWERIGEEKVDMSECERPNMFKRIPLEAMCQPRNSMLDVLSNL